MAVLLAKFNSAPCQKSHLQLSTPISLRTPRKSPATGSLSSKDIQPIKKANPTHLTPAILFPSASSKKSLHGLFPPNLMRSISIALNASIVILRTKLICTPNPRCTPAQLRQMKTPNLGDAHCGDGAPQSAHRSLPLTFWISRSWEEVRDFSV